MNELELFNFDENDFDSYDFGLDFNLDAENKDEQKNFVRVKRHKKPTICKYKNATNLVDSIGKIEEGEHINAIVSGNFIAGDLIEAYIERNKLTVSELIISTFSLSRENVDSLKNVAEFMVADDYKIGLIVSDFFFSHERQKGIVDIVENLGKYNFALGVAGVHTKITIIKTTCGQHIVIGGSANLRSSLNIEQITIDNCKLLYEFHREWMAKILNEYQATNKMLRREKLWLQVANQEEQKK